MDGRCGTTDAKCGLTGGRSAASRASPASDPSKARPVRCNRMSGRLLVQTVYRLDREHG
jgi:hypothetical protein